MDLTIESITKEREVEARIEYEEWLKSHYDEYEKWLNAEPKIG